MKNEILVGDAVELLKQPSLQGAVNLACVDPPFGIGFKYDNYADDLSPHEYLLWTRNWLAAVHKVLADDGTLWINIGDKYAAEMKIAATDAGYHLRRWCIWRFTFGQAQRNNFTNAHTHLFYFTKHKKKFTFNASEPACRVPSDRQLKYKDKRANPNGKLPDDVWDFSRVCGSFKERNKAQHGCQLSEALLARIVRTCSKPRDLVLDCFCGTGGTLAVARKLDRDVAGCDLSPVYVAEARKRVFSVQVGDEIIGENQ